MKKHTPVLLNEVIEYLDPQANQNFIDCTAGLGGHSKLILERTAPNGKLLAIDQDPESLETARINLNDYKSRIIFVNGNFKNLDQIIKTANFTAPDGIIYDLGLALWHFGENERGFSFSKDAPLDMRLGNRKSEVGNQRTAADIINHYSLNQLSDMLYKYGDIRKSQMIAKRIVEARKIKRIATTRDLIEALQITNPKVLAPIWQAIRIEVNDEFKNLTVSLEKAIKILKTNGKIAVISFHSGEDRIVKNYFRNEQKQNILKILTKKPIIAARGEVKNNPQSRSAKLRAAQKIE